MTIVLIVIVIAGLYGAFHAGHTHAAVRHGKARGLAPSIYWRQGMRGPWVSVRGPFGTRIGHRL